MVLSELVEPFIKTNIKKDFITLLFN